MITIKSYLVIFLIFLTTFSIGFTQSDIQPSQDSILNNILGEIQENIISDAQFSYELCMQALVRAREIGSAEDEILILNLLADCYFRLANYAKAVENASQSIRLNSPVKDSLNLGSSYRILGNTHTFGLKQYDEALRYQLIALEIFQNIGDKKMIAAQYGSITWIYGITDTNTKEGMAMATEGIQIAQEINDQQLLSYNYNSKGILFNKLKMYDSAIYLLKKSNEFAAKVKDKVVHAYNKTLIGDSYLQKGDVGNAMNYFKEAAKEAEILEAREVKKDAYLGIANCYEALGNNLLAFNYFKEYAALKDTLLNSEVSQKVIYYKNQSENERQQAVISQLEVEKTAAFKEKQLMLILFVLGTSLMVVILSFILFINYQRKRANNQLLKLNNEINSQNIKLEVLNKTKDKLFSIIGHDLKGPIGNLQVMLDLFNSKIISVDDLNALLSKLNISVGGLHEMLENLLEWSQGQMQGFKIQSEEIKLKELAEKTLSFYQSWASEKGITISAEFPDGLNAVADKNHVLLIMRNLVNNAIKYTDSGGSITITGKADNQLVHIIIKDTGVGMTQDQMDDIFEFRKSASMAGTEGEKGTGFGLALCKEMAEANGGSIEVTSELGKGSEFVVTLKEKA
jgi:signal transduction histidine kinase